jgi:hypothetical protein|tara:strand:+ start:912 stop:1316 length:405 start_codon:yes stop_codon:yes gene_type:complete
MDDELKTTVLHELASISNVFYVHANSVQEISAAFDNNATPDEMATIMKLFNDIQVLQDGSYDPGPYVLLGAKAETEEEFNTLAQKQIDFAELYTAIVSRAVPQATLGSLLDSKAESHRDGFQAANAPSIARLCI